MKPINGISAIGLAVGAAFGFLICAARLNDYDVIHNMLLLRDLQPYLVMGTAVAVAAPALWLLERRRWHTPAGGALELDRAQVERRHVWGSLLFGGGWAVTGACPGTALAMPAAGTLLGLPVVAGLFGGVLLREVVARRHVRADLPDTMPGALTGAARLAPALSGAQRPSPGLSDGTAAIVG